MKCWMIIVLSLGCALWATAQQDGTRFRIGAYGGFYSYFGDLNRDYNVLQARQPLNNWADVEVERLLAKGLSFEYSPTPSLGIKLLGTQGRFQARDRAIHYKSGDFLEHTNFNRAINVETNLTDASILLTYYTDNGYLLAEDFWIAPYLSVGFGYTWWETFSDLFDEQGNRYFYWSDATIRNLAENDPNAATAVVVEQDGIFETELATLQTENIDYATHAWNIPVAFGLKFRLGERFNLNIEALLRYVNSDYLDDVSGDYPTEFNNPNQAYASNPSGQVKVKRGDDRAHDLYGLVSLSLHYNFGKRKLDFATPIFYTKDVGITPEKTAVVEMVSTEESTTLTTDTTVEKVTKIDSVTEIIEKATINESIEKEEISTEIAEKTEVMDTVVERVDSTLLTVKDTSMTEEVSVVIDEVQHNETDSTNTNAVTSLEILTEVQQTRLEVARLNQKLLTVFNTSGDSLQLIRKTLDSVENKQTQIEEQALVVETDTVVRSKTDTLKTELKQLKEKYALLSRLAVENDTTGLSALKAKLESEYLQNQIVETTLQKEVQQLQENNQKLHSENEQLENKKGKSSVVWNPSRTRTKEATKGKTITNDKEEEVEESSILAESIKKTGTTVEAEEALQKSIPDDASAEVKDYDKALQEINKAITILQHTNQSATKQVLIDSLTNRIAFLESRLENLRVNQKNDKRHIRLLENKIHGLSIKLLTLKEENVLLKQPKQNTLSLVDKLKPYESTNIFFDKGSTTIQREFHQELNRITQLLQRYPTVNIFIKGFSDKSGNIETNFQLSKKRAFAVRDYFLGQAISYERIRITYFGASQATHNNDPFFRRVEVTLQVGE